MTVSLQRNVRKRQVPCAGTERGIGRFVDLHQCHDLVDDGHIRNRGEDGEILIKKVVARQVDEKAAGAGVLIGAARSARQSQRHGSNGVR